MRRDMNVSFSLPSLSIETRKDTLMAMTKGEAPLSGKKNQGEGANASKIQEMTHNRKHNPSQDSVNSKRISPSVEKSSPK